jgi:DNA-directed RNA polymerase III subunit RPC1
VGRSLLPFEIIDILDRELCQTKFHSECTSAYLASIRDFVSKHVIYRLADVRKSHGMFEALIVDNKLDTDTDLSEGISGEQNDGGHALFDKSP